MTFISFSTSIPDGAIYDYQIDIPSDIHVKAMKSSQRYISGLDTATSLYDDAQLHVFKELLPYWAAFRKSQNVFDSEERPSNVHLYRVLFYTYVNYARCSFVRSCVPVFKLVSCRLAGEASNNGFWI